MEGEKEEEGLESWEKLNKVLIWKGKGERKKGGDRMR